MSKIIISKTMYKNLHSLANFALAIGIEEISNRSIELSNSLLLKRKNIKIAQTNPNSSQLEKDILGEYVAQAKDWLRNVHYIPQAWKVLQASLKDTFGKELERLGIIDYAQMDNFANKVTDLAKSYILNDEIKSADGIAKGYLGQLRDALREAGLSKEEIGNKVHEFKASIEGASLEKRREVADKIYFYYNPQGDLNSINGKDIEDARNKLGLDSRSIEYKTLSSKKDRAKAKNDRISNTATSKAPETEPLAQEQTQQPQKTQQPQQNKVSFSHKVGGHKVVDYPVNLGNAYTSEKRKFLDYLDDIVKVKDYSDVQSFLREFKNKVEPLYPEKAIK